MFKSPVIWFWIMLVLGISNGVLFFNNLFISDWLAFINMVAVMVCSLSCTINYRMIKEKDDA